MTEFSTGLTGNNTYGITAGPDGNLWFIEYSYNVGYEIGRITPTER